MFQLNSKNIIITGGAESVKFNVICPSEIENNQDYLFKQRIENLIPIGRIGEPHGLKGAIFFCFLILQAILTEQFFLLTKAELLGKKDVIHS
jgi:hypothetical protein